jgi:hypothetical protein
VVPVSLNMSARIIITRSAITELLMHESIRALAGGCDLLAAGTTESSRTTSGATATESLGALVTPNAAAGTDAEMATRAAVTSFTLRLIRTKYDNTGQPRKFRLASQ